MKTATIREAVAVFDDPDRLENAVSDLQSNGIDRSNLSLLAHPLWQNVCRPSRWTWQTIRRRRAKVRSPTPIFVREGSSARALPRSLQPWLRPALP